MVRAWIAVALAALVVGATAAPSAAQSKVRQDQVGDHPARFDLTSVKVQDNQARIAVTVRVRRVQPGRTGVLVDLVPRRGGYQYFVYSLPTGKRTYMLQLRAWAPGDDGDRAVDCPGMTVRWDQGRRGFARFVLPQRCLPARGAIMQTSVMTIDAGELGARSVARRGDGDDVDLASDGLGAHDVGAIVTRRGRA